MSAHTPGPWMPARHGSVVAHVDGRERQVAMACGEAPMHDDRSAEPPDPGVIQKANAHLIAAAPDLLEALRGLAGDTPGPSSRPCWCHEDDCQCRDRPWCAAARAAIAKAEGKS